MKSLLLLSLFSWVASTAISQSAASAENFFQTKYKKEKHSKFTGIIQKIDKYTTKFDQKFIQLLNPDPQFDCIIHTGLLYPSLFPEPNDSVRITNLKELQNPTPTVKRYSFWLFFKGWANPVVAYIELSNPYAKKKTSKLKFIKKSALTFFGISRQVII